MPDTRRMIAAGTGTLTSSDLTTALGPYSKSFTITAVKTADYAAAANEFVPADTTSGGVTVTLPTAPADGTRVGVKHVVQGSTNAVTVALGGSDVFNKAGGSTSGTLPLLNQAMTLLYKATGAIWYVQADDMPLSQLDARFVFKGAVQSKSANYTALSTDATVLGTAGGSGITVTLPAVTAGQTLTVKKVDSGAGYVTISPASGTIDGASSIALATQYSSVTLLADGTNWWVV